MRFTSALPAFVASVTALNISTVYQFPDGVWVENIAGTRNGSFLVTTIGTPQVYMINPQVTPATASLIATFSNATAAIGITEYDENVFAVAVGSLTPQDSPVPQSFSIWKIDLSCDSDSAKVGKISEIPDVAFANGLAALNTETVLIANSWEGNIVAFDTQTGATEVVLEDPTLLPNFNATGNQLGANGLKLRGDYLYYTNTVQTLLGRVRIDPATGRSAGSFETLASSPDLNTPDDICVADDGTVFVSAPLANQSGDTIQRVGVDGNVSTIASGGSVAGTTSSAFGRTEEDKDVLYLSTSGGQGPNGALLAGGRVVAVDLK